MAAKSLSLVALLSLVLLAVPSRAMETDQYNLPPQPLADIGDEVTQYVWDNIFQAAAKLNAEIDAREACVRSPHVSKGSSPESDNPPSGQCAGAQKDRAKLQELRSPDAIAKAVYKLLGDGTIFTTHAGDWLTSHDFAHTPARFRPDFEDSIYVTMPIDHILLSPTIHMNGVEFGTDKFDHFFQQGYEYYKIYNKQLAKGNTPEQAAAKANAWGKRTEKTYFGYWVSGVFSNADLYANYAGMKFYLGLTQPLKIGLETRPATLSIVDGKWQVNGDAASRAGLLKPFVTEHLNEALNPSGYTWLVYPTVRRVVKNKSCPQWRSAFPTLTKIDAAARTKSLELWNGENYGHSPRGRMVPIAETCFGDPAER